MQGCIFCKIVNGEIPNYTIHEDAHVLAFLDINPHAKGHTVLIPKVHAENLFDLNKELSKDLFLSIEIVMEKIELVLHPDGFNVGWNHGEAGGQEVSHLHIHILPRFENDGGGNVHSIVNNDGGMSVEEVIKLF
ncbi:MAG: HIT family protein [Candidatus Magasanikbacteria bacterium CG_4_10_14_0_2_um_filter_37_12]|uniref:HIT family protein n=1 Tax=Candidatus Magasanikbacteria bacterium CG_4_10_14_0_2_um_filter_37_12 TaxID=1974637 RepID=A0A2M7V8Q7_9BACT|nr:MAG: HIT family protein [Candidatus Magasanikbacteria bacterium CG_4_10_14_0_2_um_filter_37_12]